MKKLIFLSFFLSIIFSSQASNSEKNTYLLITTNNDTTQIIWYRISHYFSNYFCEYQIVNEEYKKIDLDELLSIQNLNGYSLYPNGGFKNIEEFISFQNKTKSRKLKSRKPNIYKGWRIISGFNLCYLMERSQVRKDKLMGFRIGIEKTTNYDNIFGAIYSRRNYHIQYLLHNPHNPQTELINELELNYLTGYFLKSFTVGSGIDLLFGIEAGIFLNGNIKAQKLEFITIISEWINPETGFWEGFHDIHEVRLTNSLDMDGKDWKNISANRFTYGVIFGGKFAINQRFSLEGTCIITLANNIQADFDNYGYIYLKDLTHIGIIISQISVSYSL